MRFGAFRAAVAVFCLTSAQTAAAQTSDGPWEDYTEDPIVGAIFQWNAVGGTTFWIKDGEMEKPSHGNWISFWLRGEHSRDAEVKYRTSLRKVTIQCSGSYSVSAFTTHLPNGKVGVSEDFRYPTSTAVRPDTVMWSVMKEFCP